MIPTWRILTTLCSKRRPPLTRVGWSSKRPFTTKTAIGPFSTALNWPNEYQAMHYKPTSHYWPDSTPVEVKTKEQIVIKLSHVKGPNSPPLLSKTMWQTLESTRNKYPRNMALSVPYQGISWTYEDLGNQVESIAVGLLQLGIGKGDRIGVWLPNGKEWITLQYAAGRIGAILVCINPAYRANELQNAINLTGVKILFFCPALKSSNYAQILKLASPKLAKSVIKPNQIESPEMPSLKFLVHTSSIIQEDNLHKNPKSHEDSLDGIPSIHYDSLLANSRLTSSRLLLQGVKPVDVHEPTNLQFTSGTTGSPKATTLTHHNIVNNGFFVGERLGLTSKDVLVTPTPMYHCFGCVMSNIAAITHGTHLVYPSPIFNAELTLKAVHQFRGTVLYGVPTMFITEMSLPNFESYNVSTLRTGIMAGSNCPESVMNAVRTKLHMPDVTICYGMTETSPVSIQTITDDPIWARVETVGKVQNHLDVRIVDEDGNVVPVGQAGEIMTKGYSVMKGYWGNEEATKECIIDGWMKTGDLGLMDEQGYVRVIGRSKDMISRGGEKVYPREIEEYLYSHPSIQDVQIVGVPDERLGEELFAWVKLKTNAEPIRIDDLRTFCYDKIAHFKIPKYVECLKPGEEYPLTITGKVQKYVLRARATAIVSIEK